MTGTKVYPRVCGAAEGVGVEKGPLGGLSPRVRGSLGELVGVVVEKRSIPACAGQPRRRLLRQAAAPVYPRVCGAALCVQPRLQGTRGLSPRVRGSPRPARRHRVRLRSIPACAGQPCARAAPAWETSVYPRVCGAAPWESIGSTDTTGLSPRVRGSRSGCRHPGPRRWSIPACAGQPQPGSYECPVPGVYPRVCGAACGSGRMRPGGSGLSPRVRGSLHQTHVHRGHRGSIPACAGQPTSTTGMKESTAVYPRVCGAARRPLEVKGVGYGLSPRVRGSRVSAIVRVAPGGSIPACAGQPGSEAAWSRARWVYPRVCGAAYAYKTWAARTEGLSPRVRGSQRHHCGQRCRLRSIPACAGQPRPGPATNDFTPVYPRVCGAAARRESWTRTPRGLSPRVRGSQCLANPQHRRIGSIPACAGQPPGGSPGQGHPEVYPRVCGAANA